MPEWHYKLGGHRPIYMLSGHAASLKRVSCYHHMSKTQPTEVRKCVFLLQAHKSRALLELKKMVAGFVANERIIYRYLVSMSRGEWMVFFFRIQQ